MEELNCEKKQNVGKREEEKREERRQGTLNWLLHAA